MRVTFISQEWSNFKAFRGLHSLRWDNPGLNYLHSDNAAEPGLTANGCGKSSVFDAWCWCFFGRTPHNLRNPDVVPWVVGGTPTVTNYFLVDDRECLLTRGPGKLTLNDEDISQNQLTELIGFELELAVNAILLAQDKTLFFDLEPKNKLGLFSDALGLERWDTRAGAAADRTKAHEAALRNLETELSGYEASLETLTELLTRAETEAKAWAGAQRVRVRDAAARKEALQHDLDKQETALGSALLRMDGAGTEAKALRAEVLKLHRQETQSEGALARAKQLLADLERDLRGVEGAIVTLAAAKMCPTCGQPVKPANLAQHKAELETKRAALAASVKSGIDPKLTNAVKFYGEKLATSEVQLKGFEDREEAAASEVRRRSTEVAELKAKLAELARATEQDNPHTETIRDLTTKIKKAKADIASCKGDIEKVKRETERSRFWIKGFRDLKLELITDVLADFELNTSSMMEEVGLVNWEINYTIEQETKAGTMIRAINTLIKSPSSKKAVRWESWSGGEKQRLKLIGALALSDTLLANAGIETNLEILDEPASYWSAAGVGQLISFLAERARVQNKSIYLVEHSAVESSHFTRTLKVVRDNDGAHIE